MKHNPKNERVKRKYFNYLTQAKGRNSTTVDGVAKALNRFESYTKRKDFKLYHYEQANGFKKYLAKQINEKTDKPLSKATIHTTLRHLKKFFEWLCREPGYKSSLQHNDMAYFNMSVKDIRVASAKREKRVPTLEQILHVLNSMESTTPIQLRNRALIAFTLLSGARDAAIASMKIKHVDLVGRRVIQDAREVNTKFSKTFTSYFFPVGEDIVEIVADWITYLKSELKYGNDDPLFPQTAIKVNEQKKFEASGLKRECWSNANAIRKIFNVAFTAAGLDYFNPHSFRDTLVRLGETSDLSIEEFKAWSQNLGHDDMLTTLTSYGEVQPQRQAEILEKLKNGGSDDGEALDKLAQAVLDKMRKNGDSD